MQLTLNNFAQPNNKKLSFKGHTEKATPVYPPSSPCGSGSGHHTFGKPEYYDVKGATPNYPGAYPNEYTKIYVAAPFEIVPDDAYKTHDYTRRTDMRLSDIQKSYKDMSYSTRNLRFSSNSEKEKMFLEGLLENAIIDEGMQAEKAKRYRGMHNLSEDKETRAVLETKLNGAEVELATKKRNTNILEETLSNANERHKLLTELDNLRRETSDIKDAQYNTWKLTCIGTPESRMNDAEQKISKIFAEHKSAKKTHQESSNAFETLKQNPLIDKLQLEENIAKEKTKYETTYKNALKEAKELRAKWNNERKWNEYQKDFPAAISKVERLMDECMKKIEILYKTKYPHWL